MVNVKIISFEIEKTGPTAFTNYSLRPVRVYGDCFSKHRAMPAPWTIASLSLMPLWLKKTLFSGYNIMLVF